MVIILFRSWVSMDPERRRATMRFWKFWEYWNPLWSFLRTWETVCVVAHKHWQKVQSHQPYSSQWLGWAFVVIHLFLYEFLLRLRVMESWQLSVNRRINENTKAGEGQLFKLHPISRGCVDLVPRLGFGAVSTLLLLGTAIPHISLSCPRVFRFSPSFTFDSGWFPCIVVPWSIVQPIPDTLHHSHHRMGTLCNRNLFDQEFEV